MSVSGSHIVAIAHTHLGEAEVPLGSNTGPFVISCQRATFLDGTRWPWCAAFVCKVAAEAGVPLAYNGAGAHDLAGHHAATRQTARTARPGDVVDFNIGSGHTGILMHLDIRAGTVTTIDGNWGDKVAVHVSPLRLVRGFWRIPGVTWAPAAAPRRRLPPFVVATSANGHRKILFRAATKKGLIRWLGLHNLARIAPNGVTITRSKPR